MNHPMQVKPATNEPKLSPFGKVSPAGAHTHTHTHTHTKTVPRCNHYTTLCMHE